ncbi:MAG: class I tRNA ligase family protein, partial [Oscillospiraceae bacterium]
AMHKSLGNGIAPEEVIKDYGADMLRLWVASADYTQDMRISKDILKQLSQAYLKIRNTARYMISNLYDFNPDTDCVALNDMTPLDKFALHCFNELCKTSLDAYNRYEFHAVYRAIYNFCVIDQSNFYLDIIKDRLYCEAPNSKERRSAQTALYLILDGMTRLLAPILAFTSEEIWKEMPHAKADNAESVLLNDMPGYDSNLVMTTGDLNHWHCLVSLRDAVNRALENARKNGVLKKNQDAEIVLHVSPEHAKPLADAGLATLCIVSKLTVVAGGTEGETAEDCFIPCSIEVSLSDAAKCVRCWNHNEHLGENDAHPDLCPRCAKVVETL